MAVATNEDQSACGKLIAKFPTPTPEALPCACLFTIRNLLQGIVAIMSNI